MDREAKKNEIMLQIWELRMKVSIWRFIFGKNSSPEKVKEFNQYFTGRILHEFQEAYQTKILVDLRTILDKSKNNVVSVFKIIDKEKLKKLSKVYADVKVFTNNSITHRNVKRGYTYRFIDIINTIDELQKVLDEDNQDIEIKWNSEDLIQNELTYLYDKIKRVNEWDNSNK